MDTHGCSPTTPTPSAPSGRRTICNTSSCPPSIQHPHRQWLHRLRTLNTACEQHITQLRALQTTLQVRARWSPAAHDAVHVITHEINQLDQCRTPLATLLDRHTIERTA